MKKKWSQIVILTITFTFFVFNIVAQTGSLKGTIKHGEDPLHAATVSLGNKTIFSNRDGEFSFKVSPGIYKLSITHIGYKSIVREIKIEADSITATDFKMIPTEQLDEVVIIGSRSDIQRSSTNTPVPVDVFSSKQLLQTGQVSLTQMLTFSAPSFNASREILNEPATLRNLDPQHVLILVNSRRHHNNAMLYGGSPRGQLGRGSVSNDLNSIPLSSIKKIEVLRDGAAAQYGSEAIAGVINIHLKESIDHTSINLNTCQFYEGDGEKISFGINSGFSLNDKGFVTLSGDFRYQAPTYRGGKYNGIVYTNNVAVDDSMVKARNFNRFGVADNIGNFENTVAGILMNGGYSVDSNTQIFWTATVNKRKTIQEGFFRPPKNKNQVNLDLFPDGYRPRGEFNTDDITVIGGLKGKSKNNLSWNFSNSYGINSVTSYLSNANNPSQYLMGKNAPTTFYTGKRIYKLLTNGLNFSKPFSKLPGQVKSMNLGFGAEWRWENYQSLIGDSASWHNYDPTGSKQAGVGGSISPANAKNKNRNVLGSYLDMEVDLNDRLLIDIATRYEFYSDYGGNLAAKFAARYKFSEKFCLRTSIGNGFRAPSLQQRYNGGINSAVVTVGGIREIRVRGNFPNDHEVVRALGVPSLTAEKSINISGGLAAKVSTHISLTVDAYWIQIKDRIVLSGRFDRGKKSNGLDSVLSDFSDLKQIDQVNFYSNAIDTRTRGIDVVLNGNWKVYNGDLRMVLAANFNRTHIYAIKSAANLPSNPENTNTLFGRSDRGNMEKGQPSSKIILNMNYSIGKWAFSISNTRFGGTGILGDSSNVLDEFFSPKILTDISSTLSPKPWLSITAGVNNVFNIYPDPFKNYDSTAEGTQPYSPEASPFGFNGGYYFVRMSFNF